MQSAVAGKAILKVERHRDETFRDYPEKKVLRRFTIGCVRTGKYRTCFVKPSQLSVLLFGKFECMARIILSPNICQSAAASLMARQERLITLPVNHTTRTGFP